MTETKLRICCKCGWGHFPRSREEVELESKDFKSFIDRQTSETQAMYGIGPLSTTGRVYNVEEAISRSEQCFRCGNSHLNFRDENDLDHFPKGVTIQGIIKE
jgi:ribosomal protein L37E